jgi:hypothetical protein
VGGVVDWLGSQTVVVGYFLLEDQVFLQFVVGLLPEAGIEAVLDHVVRGLLVVAHWRSLVGLLEDCDSPIVGSESRRLMVDYLLLNALHLAPTVSVLVLVGLSRFESLVGREEGRFVQLAVFELLDELLVLGHSSVDVVLSGIIAADLDLAVFRVESLGIRCENSTRVELSNPLQQFQVLLPPLLLGVEVRVSSKGAVISCLFLILPNQRKARLLRAKTCGNLLLREGALDQICLDHIGSRTGDVSILGQIGIPLFGKGIVLLPLSLFDFGFDLVVPRSYFLLLLNRKPISRGAKELKFGKILAPMWIVQVV